MMDTDIILLFLVGGLICVTIGGIGLYLTVKDRLDYIEKNLREAESELITHKRDIRVLKERDAQKSDRIYIYTEEDSNKVRLGGF